MGRDKINAKNIPVCISLLEQTAPPLCLPEEGLSQPLSACTDGSYTDGQVVQYTADRAERGWAVGGVLSMEDEGVGGAVRSKSDIYSLVCTEDDLFYSVCIDIALV